MAKLASSKVASLMTAIVASDREKEGCECCVATFLSPVAGQPVPSSAAPMRSDAS